MIATLLSAAMVAQTIRMAVPYVCAGIGGVWSERSGVVNIALEGTLLGGALAGVVGHLATGSAAAGLVAGALVGAMLGATHALLVVVGGIDAIVSGLAINLAVVGGTRFVLRALYASSSNSPSIRGFPVTVSGASDAALLARTLLDPTTLLAALLVAWSGWTLAQMRLGLRVRAARAQRRPRPPGSTCGECVWWPSPSAAPSRVSGASPSRTTSTGSSLG